MESCLVRTEVLEISQSINGQASLNELELLDSVSNSSKIYITYIVSQ